MKTQLIDRELWFDGVSVVEPERLQELLLKGIPISKLGVTSVTPEIKQFNLVADEKIAVKTELNPIGLGWTLPEPYKYLDVDEYLTTLLEKVDHDALYEARLARFMKEVELFRKLNLYQVFRTLVYVLDELKRQEIVWGVGRGSSCSSYLLYLLGLHDVDPVLYDIDVEDFIRIA